MSADKRNFLVGITVIAAFVIFGWMFMRFGSKTASLFAPKQQKVEIDAPRVDGLSEGSPITYQGVVVGRIVKLTRNADGTGVTVSALLETEPPVPLNVSAEIVTTSLISGGATVALQLPTDSKTHEEIKPRMLKEGGQYPTIHAAYVGLKLNIFPSEYGDVAQQIARAAKAFADASQEVHDVDLVKNFNDTVLNIKQQSERTGEILRGVQELVGDPATKRDLKEIIVNAHQASVDLTRISGRLAAFGDSDLPRLSHEASGVMANANAKLDHAQEQFDELSKQIGQGLTKISLVLDDVHSITAKIDQGKGSVGLAVNDPKLYQGLVDSSRELDADLKSLDRLIDQWTNEGMYLKLSK